VNGNDVNKPLRVVSSASASNEAKYDAVSGSLLCPRRHGRELGTVDDTQKYRGPPNCLETVNQFVDARSRKIGGC
jgi:hypothetical protein